MKKTILIIVLALLCLNFRAGAQNNAQPTSKNIIGKVTDELGQPLSGATVKLKQSTIGIITDKDGNFIISHIPANGMLIISFIGYQTAEIHFDANNVGTLTIYLKADANSLNEVQVIGYGKTTKRLNTGNVSTITAKEIENQPVTNLLSTIEGRAPGVFVQQTNGLPGGGFNIQIRGKGSILAGTDPLYVIDGVPYSTDLMNANPGIGSTSANGLVSPLNSINPSDIESMSILKDADATAIYGSRGANGVVLITTKKGKAGKTKVDFNLSEGVSKIASLPSLLNLQQYLLIRKEAYKNDGLTPSSDPTAPNYAPDLTVWDQNNSTNWAKYLFGGTGHVTDVQGSVSGGDKNTTFNIGGNFHSETTVLQGNNLYQRGGIRYNLQHNSLDNKFSIALSGTYTIDHNQLANPNEGDIFLPPNFPLYTASGAINWAYGLNPLADVKAQSEIRTDNFVTNLVLKYNILSDLNFSTSIGYNKTSINQVQTFPLSSQNPQYSPVNYSNFADNSNQSIIVEPQLNYKKQFNKSSLNLLLGGTYQSSLNQGQTLSASNFSSDELLQNFASAGSINGLSNSYLQYKYVSVFGRVNYNFDDKYIFNASIRRDGSSRFGPGNQFGTFGAIGAAWLFSQENWLKDNLPFISYGKIRASYGIVGNDQITNYQYLATYSSSSYNYQNISGLQPSRISNADFHWEVDKKLELALELGFIKDRILLTVDRYQSKSANQLVAYAIPTITGFNSYAANLPAIIQNTGWEVELNTKNIQQKNFSWTTTFNLTIPKNKLVSFQNLANSSYANTLVIGEDITRIYGFRLTSIDPKTGSSNYAPQPGSSSSDPYYYNTIGKQTPDFYGGFGNTFIFKSWQLDIFGQFVKQMASGDLNYTAGAYINNYQYILNRWQQPGDITSVPKASTVSDFYYAYSSANFFDASYFRLKNVSLSYTLPSGWSSGIGIDRIRVYAKGQDLYTWWHRGNPFLDPESGAYSANFGASRNLPPMRSIVFGAQITF
jgi:TonB-linked SusC/RagA family outer membrane protein